MHHPVAGKRRAAAIMLVAAAVLVSHGEGFSAVVGAARRDGTGSCSRTLLALGARNPPRPGPPAPARSPANAGAHSDPLTQCYAAAPDALSTAAQQRRGGAAFAGVLRAAPAVDARRWGPCRGFSGRVVGAPALGWERRAHRRARAAGALGMGGNDRGGGWEEGGDAKTALNEVRVAGGRRRSARALTRACIKPGSAGASLYS